MNRTNKYLVTLCATLIVITSVFWLALHEKSTIMVAIIDTGIDLEQPPFKRASAKGYNLVNSDEPPQDDNGHGTQMASVINFLEPRLKIMPVKVIPRSGVTTKRDLARGIIVAVDNGARVINISAGVMSPSLELERAVEYAKEKDVIIVAAAGDSGAEVNYPAAYSSVISVGAVDYNNIRLPLSNTGSELDLMALGEYKTTGLNKKCQIGSGTSLAVPIVSAYIAATLISNPKLSSQEAKDLLMASLLDIDDPGKDNSTGYGLLKQENIIPGVCK